MTMGFFGVGSSFWLFRGRVFILGISTCSFVGDVLQGLLLSRSDVDSAIRSDGRRRADILLTHLPRALGIRTSPLYTMGGVPVVRVRRTKSHSRQGVAFASWIVQGVKSLVKKRASTPLSIT